jgi:hypothetical protein
VIKSIGYTYASTEDLSTLYILTCMWKPTRYTGLNTMDQHINTCDIRAYTRGSADVASAMMSAHTAYNCVISASWRIYTWFRFRSTEIFPVRQVMMSAVHSQPNNPRARKTSRQADDRIHTPYMSVTLCLTRSAGAAAATKLPSTPTHRQTPKTSPPCRKPCGIYGREGINTGQNPRPARL